MTERAPEISFVIPCYNEERRLEPGLSRALGHLVSSVKQPFELVFVDDGSTDGTAEILRRAKGKNNLAAIELLGYARNEGKGFAVRTGIMRSKGRKIIVMDADFSIDLGEIDKAIAHLDSFDIVIGTKKHCKTEILRHQKIPRRILGKGFTAITNLLLGLNFTDITCGFKGFKSEAAKDIFSRQLMKGWAYDAETLFLVKHLRYSFVEIPVKWFHVEGSKVSPVYDAVKSAKDLVSIMVHHYSGKYKRKP